MSMHIYSTRLVYTLGHARETYSTLCNPGSEPVGVASEYRYIDSFHVRIQKVLSEGVRSNSATRTIFFRLGERNQIPLKAGQHRPASELPFKWRFAGVPIMAHH